MFLRNRVHSTPDLRRLDRLDVEPGDDAKVAAATLQSPEQIRVLVLVGLDQRAISKYDFVVDHAVTGKSNLVAVEADSSGQQQTRHTHGADTTSRNGQTVRGQVFVDFGPARNPVLASMQLTVTV